MRRSPRQLSILSLAAWTALLIGTALGGRALAQLLPLPTTVEDFFQPGTQPDTLTDPIIASGACTNCHAGFSPTTAPFDRWYTSIMAQAMRDPLFHACLAVAEQDAAFVGDLCLRCHTPGGWLAGNSTPTDGSALSGVNDLDGVTCMFCHRLVDPIADPANPAEDAAILAGLASVPDAPHSGQYVVDPVDRRRGPFDLSPMFMFHEWRNSPFHREAMLCGICHDVSNPAFIRDGESYVLTEVDTPHPTHDKYDQFPVERTFSEWSMSEFAAGPVDMGGLFGGNQAEVSTCQDCHMPRTSGYACVFTGMSIFRTDLPQHDFNGSHTWVLDAILEHDLSLLLYDTPSYMAPWHVAEAQARNVSMLERASDLELTQLGGVLRARLTNNSGHKLPSGYPEGRRIWLRVEFRDQDGNLVGEHGHYDFDTAELTSADTKVYEAKLGLDAYMADVTGLPEGESFHFVLNNTYVKDNRIPPRGFTNAAFESVQAGVVGYSYADGQYWDDTDYPIPPSAVSALVTVYYQTASKEYIEFLQAENTTNDAGDILHDLWMLFDKGPPVVIDQQSIDFTTDDFQRGDCNADGALAISDPIFLLGMLFSSGAMSACLTACDSNDDGGLDLADAIATLSALFIGGAPLPAPYPDCGLDPTPDGLICLEGACP